MRKRHHISNNCGVLILSNYTGGLHSFRKEVVKAIVDAGYKVCISVPDNDERASYFKEIGCDIEKLQFNRRGKNPLKDFLLMWRYIKLIRKKRPLAVLTYTIKPNIYGGIACRLTGVPLIANVTGLGDAVENDGWLQKLTVALYKMGISKAKQVFFQNQANQNTCIKLGIADNHSIVLPGSGVNLEHHVYQEYPEDGVIKFLFIARLLKDKGTDEFLEMAKTIKEEFPQTEFQILGWIEGDYKQQLDELEAKGIVKHLGTTMDVRPFLASAHCTIMPSYHEGMSNVNLESAANGRPVITTNVPGCRETVDEGLTGFLVEPRCAKSLTDAVRQFLRLPYSQKILMGQEGRKKVEREFDRQIVVEAYLKAIGNV